MKRSAASIVSTTANMKRSYSCMDLTALETDPMMMTCSKKRFTLPSRYRSLSSGPTTREKNLNEWLQAYSEYETMSLSMPIVEGSIEDILSTSCSIPYTKSPNKETIDSVQLELIDLLQHAWIEKERNQDQLTSQTL